MTKKDYVIIAKAISECDLRGKDVIIYHLVKALRADNPKFNSTKFTDMCWEGQDAKLV